MDGKNIQCINVEGLWIYFKIYFLGIKNNFIFKAREKYIVDSLWFVSIHIKKGANFLWFVLGESIASFSKFNAFVSNLAVY